MEPNHKRTVAQLNNTTAFTPAKGSVGQNGTGGHVTVQRWVGCRTGYDTERKLDEKTGPNRNVMTTSMQTNRYNANADEC